MNYILSDLIEMISFIVCATALPIVIVWLNTRRKINETNQRTQIVLAAIEKNKETDIEDLLKKMAPQHKQKLLKEKLLAKLLGGSIFSMGGFSILACDLWLDWKGDIIAGVLFMCYSIGAIIFAIGIAFLLNYFISKKMLAKEIEAEEKKLAAEANL